MVLIENPWLGSKAHVLYLEGLIRKFVGHKAHGLYLKVLIRKFMASP